MKARKKRSFYLFSFLPPIAAFFLAALYLPPTSVLAPKICEATEGTSTVELLKYCDRKFPTVSWKYQEGYNFCDGGSPGILEVYPECGEKLLEIKYSQDFYSTLHRFSDPNFVEGYLKKVDPPINGDTIIQVLYKNNCKPIFIDPNTFEILVPNDVICPIARSVHQQTFQAHLKEGFPRTIVGVKKNLNSTI